MTGGETIITIIKRRQRNMLEIMVGHAGKK